jgi:hypothetical protein
MIFNGTDLIIFNAANDKPLAAQKSVGVTFTANMIDISTKFSEGNSEFLSGKMDVTISADCLTDWQTSVGQENASELIETYENRYKIEFRLADPTNTDIYFEGEGYLESLELNAGTEDVATFTGTIMGTGEWQSLVS